MLVIPAHSHASILTLHLQRHLTAYYHLQYPALAYIH